MKGRLPNRLRVLRAERGFSQVDLALKAGLTPSRYWKIENAVPPEPTDDERRALVKALHSARAPLSEDGIWPADALKAKAS